MFALISPVVASAWLVVHRKSSFQTKFFSNSTQCYKCLFLIPGQLNNPCIKDFNNCQQGISISFWLQFIDGLYIVAITNANKTILSLQVKDYRNLLIQLTVGSSRWQIKRSCFPVGWFYLTITWDHTSKSVTKQNKDWLALGGLTKCIICTVSLGRSQGGPGVPMTPPPPL